MGQNNIPFETRCRQKLLPRSRTIVEINVINDLKVSYLEKQIIKPGIFFGNSSIENRNGKAYLPVIDTTEEEIEMFP